MNRLEETRTRADRSLTVALWESAPSGTILLELLAQAETFRHRQISSLDRQLRLFAAWCARRTSPLLGDARSRRAIQTAELFATDSATGCEVDKAYREACAAVREIAVVYEEPGAGVPFGLSAETSLTEDGVNRELAFACALLNAAYAASHACSHSIGTTGGMRAAMKCAATARDAIYWQMIADGADTALVADKLEEENRRQAEALRTFIGNPFDEHALPPLTLAPAGAKREREQPRLRSVS